MAWGPLLIDSGAEPLLVALLALAGRADGRMLFVTRQQDFILPLYVEPEGKGTTEVTAGTYETITTKISTFRFDTEAGTPAKSPDGKPILESRTYDFTTAGRPVRWAIGNTPLHLEIRPSSGAPGTPIGTATAFLRGWAAKDDQALLSLIEWDSVFEEWSKGPGAAELAGKSEQEIAAIRDGFPPDFVHGMTGSVGESQAKTLKLMANPVFWVEEPLEGGDVLVRMTDVKAKESPSLGGFRFRVRRTAEKACQIVGFPPPK